MSNFKRGFLAGFPIGLGYLSVSFTFGIMAVSYGLTWWQATLISMTTVTSAGQFAGLGVMMHPGQYFQMLVSQITINIRYSFMSISIGQKADSKFKGLSRWILGFLMTDEIFAVASAEPGVISPHFMYGLIFVPVLGWTLGTALGALASQIMPAVLSQAMELGLYAMFIAIIIPPAKKNRAVAFVIALAVVLACIFYVTPVLKEISVGFQVILATVIASSAGAFLFPVAKEDLV